MKFMMCHFDEFAYMCQYFTSETAVNNGYGCTHPEQEETDPDRENGGKEHGKCYDFSCPLCLMAEEEDFDPAQHPDYDLDGATMDDYAEGEYVLVNVDSDASEDEKKAYASYERFLHRYDFEWLNAHSEAAP